MANRIQIRRDVSTSWTTVNPILAQGECGFETDTKKMKIGDGTTAWNSLSYLALPNDGTLTIKKNNVAIGSFSADQSTATTVNITVPTKTSDITNDSGFQTSTQVTTAITSETNPIKSTVTTMQTAITNISSTVTTMQTTMSNYGDVVTHDADEFYSSTNPNGYQTSTQVTTAISSSVINNVTTPTTNAPLSANMGKELQTEINNLKNIGRFLAIWNSATGLPLTNPTTMPYAYKTGDYYRVGVVGTTTNYKPTGSSYDGTASTTEETEDVAVGWVYYYDGTQWLAQSGGGGGTVQDVQIDGTSIVESGTGIASMTTVPMNITYSDDTTATLNIVGSLS